MNLHKRFITKDDTITLTQSLVLFVVGLLLGTVFIFGQQYWNKTITKEECTYIETQFFSFEEIKHRSRVTQIAIDCADGERYFIEQVLIDTKIREAVSGIEKNEDIAMLIHPTGGNILELTHNDKKLLKFDESMEKLGKNAKTFGYLGLFMYLASLMGLVCAVLNIGKSIKTKKKKLY